MVHLSHVSSVVKHVLLIAPKRYKVFIFQGNFHWRRINDLFLMDRLMTGRCAGLAQDLVHGRAFKNEKKTLR